MEAIGAEAVVAVSADQERCTTQPAQTAVSRHRYPSSQQQDGRYTAANATVRERRLNKREVTISFLLE